VLVIGFWLGFFHVSSLIAQKEMRNRDGFALLCGRKNFCVAPDELTSRERLYSPAIFELTPSAALGMK
jgi:hypothetical protein